MTRTEVVPVNLNREVYRFDDDWIGDRVSWLHEHLYRACGATRLCPGKPVRLTGTIAAVVAGLSRGGTSRETRPAQTRTIPDASRARMVLATPPPKSVSA